MEHMQVERPQISPLKQAIYVGVVWLFWFCSLYTILFVSWIGFLAPLIVAQYLYYYLLRRNALTWFPYQRQLVAWWQTTFIYDIFIRRTVDNKKLRPYLGFGLLFLVVGAIPFLINLASPIYDLSEMTVVEGIYEGHTKLGRKNYCGSNLVTFRTNDGSVVKFWSSANDLEGLERTKGEKMTLWGEPTTTHMAPECRQNPVLAQIQGPGYTKLYDRQQGEKANRLFRNVSIFFLSCGGLCLLRVAIARNNGFQ